MKLVLLINQLGQVLQTLLNPDDQGPEYKSLQETINFYTVESITPSGENFVVVLINNLFVKQVTPAVNVTLFIRNDDKELFVVPCIGFAVCGNGVIRPLYTHEDVVMPCMDHEFICGPGEVPEELCEECGPSNDLSVDDETREEINKMLSEVPVD